MPKVLIILKMQDIIIRPTYMDRIRPYIGKNIIKVLTGQRRVGKSFILKAIVNELRLTYPHANFIDINLEDFAFSHIRSAEDLHDEITSKLDNHQQNFIFIDEVQEIEGFDRVIRSLILREGTDVYVTGSNSRMLSAEIASRLAGRSVEIRVHPLTYAEFLTFQGIVDSDSALDLYMHYGGLPYLVNLPNHNSWGEYLASVTDAVVYRDVVTRNALRNNDFLQRLLLFLADSIGQIFSAKRIADYLKSQRQSTTVNSVQNYVDYIAEAYIANRVRRWDIEGKRYFEIGEKIFFEDIGIRNSIAGFKPNDIGGIMENMVYNHLTAKEYAVRIGVIDRGREIDFVAEKNGEQKYIQVAVNVSDTETAQREFGNLQEIGDNYEKIVVTLRDSAPNTLNGIRMMSLRQFLLTT